MPEDKGLSRSQREEKVLQFWKDNQIFKKTLERKSPQGDFVFYEGPPTANGKPGIHHLESRSFKDAIPRYKTMQGFRVPRKAGWDTHGLPVELQIEKKLGFTSKKDIEAYGIEKFNEECKKSVWEYVSEWRNFSDRMGYWLDFDHPYITYKNEYISSVWSILKHVEGRKLLYKDYKVLPWCPRCGTALSSHELAQGYQDVKDLSLYVKFKIVGATDGYFVAWTTTPWTLPGNVGLAVGADIVYVEAKVGKEILVLAKEKLALIKEPYEIVAEHKGSEMVGMQYEPLYNFIENNGKAFRVYAADFVTTEDGTGIVHTAVMYGQEDFELGTKVGLPKVHLVAPDGTFMKGTGWLEGRSVVDPELAVDILKDLKERGLLFDKENYTHSYPFCWRCKTRLIYYARDSWYIRMSSLRGELIKENEKINWEPEYIKEGRFGEWLREVKDWAVSRERYWGTPLPVWQNADASKRIVIGSIDELKEKTKKSGNTYFVMRHGQAESNAKGILSGDKDANIQLVEAGKEKARESAQSLKGAHITKIFTSPFHRTRDTAHIVKEALKLDVEIVEDARLSETSFGVFEGKDRTLYRKEFRAESENFDIAPEGGETLNEMKKRVGDFLYELEKNYTNENILIVSHGDPIWMLDTIAHGYDSKDAVAILGPQYLETGAVRELPFVPLPHNENFELDVHKPFIDGVVLEEDGEEYSRVKEVMDVWFDSGAVPFAQDPDNVLYPADFISEAIDQTRGWFYTLHAVGILMEKGRAFKNVISLGHLLDKDGKKMSKSIGNVIEPWEMFEKYGADVLRFWMYSVNQPGEPKNFDQRTVDEVQKKVFNMLDNVLAFYELYRDKDLENIETRILSNPHVLDKWIITRSNKLMQVMTDNLDKYRLLEPARELRDFIDDLSTWYLRRSRERIKGGDTEAKKMLHFMLLRLAKVLAPFAPFYAEELWLKLRTSAHEQSVHLANWPHFVSVDTEEEKVLHNMREVRKIVSLGLEARNNANIKIRQPLLKLSVKSLDLSGEYLELIKDEINVKEVVEDKNLAQEVALDTNLTPELIEEGQVREIIRSIQEMRKEKNLMPKDTMKYEVTENAELLKKYKDQVEKTTNVELLFTVY